MQPSRVGLCGVMARWAILPALAAAVYLAAGPCREAPGAEDPLAKRIGCPRGVCVLLEDKECGQALDLVRATELTVYVQLSRPEDVEAARRAADAAGQYGTRLFVEQGKPVRIHLADDIADALAGPADAAGVSKAEILRVLRPGGKAILGQEELAKPWPAGADDWSHPYHGPDNNPQSADRLARAPYLTQFIAEPRYGPAPQAAVASAGRLFAAFGNVAWHEREEPVLNTLFAVNGFNGTVLWKRALKPGLMVDRSTMIATPQTLFLADDASCKLLDAATGELKGEIVAPAGLADGTFWKWMALDGGVLYALVGPDEPRDPDARWKSRNHGWPWGGISDGYNRPQYEWGFARTLLAIDPAARKVLWHHREDQPIDARGTCMKNGRIYICRFGEYLACLDARTGREVWRRTAAKDADLFKEIGPYRPGHGFIGGWKSTVYLKCTDKALYFIGPQVEWLTALAADDGRFLWKYPAKDLHAVIREDGLYTVGPERTTGLTKKLDALTGSVLASYDVWRRACTRSTGGPDGIFFRAAEGTARLDLASGKPQWITTMRPQCHVGVVIAGGHLYWLPWACDCNLQMFGVISCAPAGDFKFDQEAREQERLEAGAGGARGAATFEESPADWPTYRANNVRTAESQAAVPEKVGLVWQFAPRKAFEATAPVAAGGMVFLAGSDGVVRAVDAATGQPRWTAYTGGAVRFPPTIAGGRALVGSGDGWAYAFEAATGRLLWRFRASPVERKIPLYGALVDTWPVASGVLVDGGTAYLAAGINNFDGTHVYALDAATGRIKWQNNTCGHLDEFSRRGVAVQGDMLLDGGKLYLAGGNAVSPALFDPADGRCLSAPPAGRGAQALRGRELVLGKGGGVPVSGQPLYSVPSAPVFDKPSQWGPQVVAAKNVRLLCEQRPGEPGAPWVLAAQSPKDAAELWVQTLPGEPVPWGLAVDRDGRILVSLRDGRVLCYGPAKP